MLDVIGRYLARIDRLGDDTRVILIRHQYVMALIMAARYREAAVLQRQILPMADRLGDSRAQGYALSGEIWLSCLVAPRSPDEMEILKRTAIEASSGIPDTFLQSHVRWIIGWEEMIRGRMTQAWKAASDLMKTGR
jgi:hypothetical protein